MMRNADHEFLNRHLGPRILGRFFDHLGLSAVLQNIIYRKLYRVSFIRQVPAGVTKEVCAL